MSPLVSVLGFLLVLGVLWDVFQNLWHPSARGRTNRVVLAIVRRTTPRLGRRARQLAGPVTMVGAIAVWTALAVAGWTLVYWPHMPGAFSYDPGLEPTARNDLADSLYLSLVTVATLGYGDIVPTTVWLRLLAPVQALMGLTMLTASVSWILQVYSAVTDRRVAAVRLAALRRAGISNVLHEMSDPTAARTVEDVATAMAAVRVDLTQYAETYYFQETDQDTALAANLGFAYELMENARQSSGTDLPVVAEVLAHALDDFARLIDDQFLRSGLDTRAVLDAYAADQGHRVE